MILSKRDAIASDLGNRLLVMQVMVGSFKSE